MIVVFILIVLFANSQHIASQSWNTNDGILPWEAYIQLADIERPLGLTLNRSSLAHHHFAIGYLCFHSFMYDQAQEAFNLAISTDSTFVEAYIGLMLGCKQTLLSETNFDCGLGAYQNVSTMLTTYNITLTPLQSSLISTVYQWYANQSSVSTGELAFSSSIANLSATYPNETDIRVLWGLSLLNVAFQHQYDGQLEPPPMTEARDVLKTALAAEPNHPGALHYIIRAYDVAQSNTSAQAIPYVLTYQNLVPSLSCPQHVPALIWMRTGAMNAAKSADEASFQNSVTLCLIKVLGHSVSTSLIQLTSVLALFNTSDQVQAFLLCDADNRATSREWLSFTRLQTGNWAGTLAPIDDLYLAYNQSIPPSNLYLSYAYRTRARAVVNLFYWLPYDIQFIGKAEEIQKLNDTLAFTVSTADPSDWSLAWSEAGYRLSGCLRLLTNINSSYSDPSVKSLVDAHLARFAVLANQTAPLNGFISASISMMILQVQGVIYYKNNSLQECLNVLSDATQRELSLVMDNNSPTLLFARSSELLAMHLLLIQRSYLDPTIEVNSSSFILNGTRVLVSQFPQYALNLYQIANLSSPNRAINILGIARANSQLLRNNIAASYYQMLLDQISSSNNSDPIFSQEATSFIAQQQNSSGSPNNNQFCLLTLLVSFLCILLIN